MAEQPQSVMDDPRPIRSLTVEGYTWSVGLHDITRIMAYPEAGEMSNVPWFAIYSGDVITERVNGKMVVGVQYEK
ncbi:MAG TPA: hypothetical protein VFX97_16970 [Pyrinomonadaceae bacterium]|nr:hypothetical protein [Pyrinomonadaceae bacterium]